MHIPLLQPPLQDVEGSHHQSNVDLCVMDAKMKQSIKSDPPILLTRHLQYAPGALNQVSMKLAVKK